MKSFEALADQGFFPILTPKVMSQMGLRMAGKPQHWKERNWRYSARIVIPPSLHPYLDNRAELEIQLGGDRRAVLRNHAAAASMQRQIGLYANRPNNSQTGVRVLKDLRLTDFGAKFMSAVVSQ